MGLVISVFEVALISGVKLVGNFMPFAIGVIEHEKDNRWKNLLYILSALTVGLRFSWITALGYCTSIILLKSVQSVIDALGWRKKNDLLFYLFGVGVVNHIIWSVFDGILIYDYIIAVLKGISMVGGYLLFSELDFSKEGIEESEFLKCLGFIGLIISGLQGLNFFIVDLKNVAGVFVILMLARSNGVKYSTMAGLVLGVMCELASPNMGVSIISLALGGFIAGLFKERNTIFQIWGFLIGNSLIAYYITGYNMLVMKFAEIAIAGSIFYVLQKKEKISIKIFDNEDLPLLAAETISGNEVAIKTLEDTSQGFEEVSEILSDFELQTANDDVFDEIKEKICFSCDRYDKCWDELYDKTTDEIFNVIEELEDYGKISENTHENFLDYGKCYCRWQILDEINEKYHIYKTKKCSSSIESLKKCMENQLKGFSQYFMQMKNKIREGNIGVEAKILKLFEEENLRVENVNVKLNDDKYEVLLKAGDSKRLNFASQANGLISKAVGKRMIASESKKDIVVFRELEKFRPMSAVITRNADGEKVLGDSYKVMDEVDEKFVGVLSDGMGTGEEAQRISSSIVEMFAKMSRNGINPGIITNMISSFMQYASNSDKIITLDALSIDLTSGECEFLKIGGAPSFIIRKSGVEIVASDSLPLGILERVEFFQERRMLEQGDIVVMVSDGVIDSKRNIVNKEFWVSSFLKTLCIDEPEVIAEELLNKTMENYGMRVLDDITILVVRID